MRSVDSLIEIVFLIVSERTCLVLCPVIVIEGAIGDSLVLPPFTRVFGFV